MRVKDVMSSPVITVKDGASLKDVAAVLVDCEINGVPVVDDEDRIVGFITEGDLLPLEEALDSIIALSYPELNQDPPRRAGDVMNREVISIPAEATVPKAARTLREYEIEQMPVVDDDGKLLGIVARRDILGVLARPDYAIRMELQEILDREAPGIGRYTAVVVGGAVTLRGRPDAPDAALATTLARNVAGVTRVQVVDPRLDPADPEC